MPTSLKDRVSRNPEPVGMLGPDMHPRKVLMV
jgi:hypothetical protein